MSKKGDIFVRNHIHEMRIACRKKQTKTNAKTQTEENETKLS